jgi:hypothetical protein
VSSKSTCREVWQNLLSPHISSLTLEGILARLGEEGELPLDSLDPKTVSGLRRQLERIGRSYLDPQSKAAMLRRFDMLLEAAGLPVPDTTTPPGAFRAVKAPDPTSSGLFRAIDPATSAAFRVSPPSEPGLGAPPTTTAPPEDGTTTRRGIQSTPTRPEPASFAFRSHEDLVALFPKLRLLLNEFLKDEAAARRLEIGLERAARGALEKAGGGEIRLEKNAGIRGRLSFQVSGLDGRVHTSGAVLAVG